MEVVSTNNFGQTQELEIMLTTNLLNHINKLLALKTEYIDLVAENESYTLSAEYKGVLVACKMPLVHSVDYLNIRLPQQVLRQMSNVFISLKIVIDNEKYKLILFKRDRTAKPYVITVMRNISDLSYYDIVKRGYESDFGNNEKMIYYLPAINIIGEAVSGLKVNDLMIESGVAFINNLSYKFFADMNAKDMNIVIPSKVMHYLKGIPVVNNCKFEIFKNMNLLRTGDLLIGWKSVRPFYISEYAGLKQKKPKAMARIGIKPVYDFINKLSLAVNREQEMMLDLFMREAVVEENIILRYEVPMEVNSYNTIDPSYEEKPIKLPIKEFCEVAKNLTQDEVVIVVYDNLVEFRVVPYVEGIGEIQLSYVLKICK